MFSPSFVFPFQIFIVTGGIRGIGRKVTERLMSLGAFVIISKYEFYYHNNYISLDSKLIDQSSLRCYSWAQTAETYFFKANIRRFVNDLIEVPVFSS